MRTIIGITGGSVVNKDYPNTPAVIGQQYTYIDAIVRAGGVPMIIPIVNNLDVLKEFYNLCNGLLFAGGHDIHPNCYDEEPSPFLGETHPERDQQELLLWEWASNDDKSVLGICRGMQLMNVGNGGTLYQDIPSEIPNAHVHRVSKDESKPDDYFKIMHQFQVEPNSKLAQILGTVEVGTNAFHHQAIKKLGKEFTVSARTDDGVIEAIENAAKKFVIAVQSHPEALEEAVDTNWQKLFKAFVVASAKG